jgi:hypothetical protein
MRREVWLERELFPEGYYWLVREAGTFTKFFRRKRNAERYQKRRLRELAAAEKTAAGQHGEGGMTIFETKPELEYHHLATLKGAIRLEKVGMKRRGKSALSLARQTYGFKGDHAKVIEQIQARMEELLKIKADKA